MPQNGTPAGLEQVWKPSYTSSDRRQCPTTAMGGWNAETVNDPEALYAPVVPDGEIPRDLSAIRDSEWDKLRAKPNHRIIARPVLNPRFVAQEEQKNDARLEAALIQLARDLVLPSARPHVHTFEQDRKAFRIGSEQANISAPRFYRKAYRPQQRPTTKPNETFTVFPDDIKQLVHDIATTPRNSADLPKRAALQAEKFSDHFDAGTGYLLTSSPLYGHYGNQALCPTALWEYLVGRQVGAGANVAKSPEKKQEESE
ncbi:uncharacterized protein LTR77_003262 [Saxophila tyrrhenica]|uniref:Uncharacterized protein n=1 Tax=Saxophila tyrrhenica TaxID=1690608 RepID=A0AAV9PHR9_9PEZI|nr:hypothetical protein LTR77_003262 [Saxophila tyrrhenica]